MNKDTYTLGAHSIQEFMTNNHFCFDSNSLFAVGFFSILLFFEISLRRRRRLPVKLILDMFRNKKKMSCCCYCHQTTTKTELYKNVCAHKAISNYIDSNL